MSIFCAFHVTKNTRLSTPAQLQCSRSRVWVPGNEANYTGCLPDAYQITKNGRDLETVLTYHANYICMEGDTINHSASNIQKTPREIVSTLYISAHGLNDHTRLHPICCTKNVC